MNLLVNVANIWKGKLKDKNSIHATRVYTRKKQ